MYVLVNTFNGDSVISRHRTIDAVAMANHRIQRRCTNGSYVPTGIRQEVKDEKGNVSLARVSEEDGYSYSRAQYDLQFVVR